MEVNKRHNIAEHAGSYLSPWRFPSDSEPSKSSERSDFLVIHASVMFPGKTIRRLYVFMSKLSKEYTVSVVGDSETARILYWYSPHRIPYRHLIKIQAQCH